MLNSCLLVGLAGKSGYFSDLHFKDYKSKKYKVESVESLSLICSDYRQVFMNMYPVLQNVNHLHLYYQDKELIELINNVPYFASKNKWFSEKYSEMIKIG